MRPGLLIALLVLVVTVLPEAGADRLALAANHTLQQIEGTIQTFQNSFDQYVHDDSIVGVGYVFVKDGQAIEWHAVGMVVRDLMQSVDQLTMVHWRLLTMTL